MSYIFAKTKILVIRKFSFAESQMAEPKSKSKS